MKVSAIFVNYNSGYVICKAIQSCLDQTVPFDEIIVVDNC